MRPRKRMGRPALYDEPMSATMKLHMPKGMLEHLQMEAKENGESVSAMVRGLIISHLTAPLPEEDEAAEADLGSSAVRGSGPATPVGDLSAEQQAG